MKTLLMTSAAVLMMSVGAASAATWGFDAYGNALPAPTVSQQAAAAANSARTPVDFGTGYYGRGTATGGPAGGLPSRN